MFSTYDLKGFSTRLKEIRKSLGYTQENVVAGTGLSTETLRKLENGITIPRYDTIEILSIFYKIDLQNVLNNYKSSKELLSFYNLVDDHILGFNVESLSDSINTFNEFKKRVDLKLIDSRGLDQLELLFKGLSLSYSDSNNTNVQYQAIQLHIDAIKVSNPSFSFSRWQAFKYNHIELRILFSIASMYGFVRECSTSNEILCYILESLDHSLYAKQLDKFLIVKVYGIMSYNFHRLSDASNSLIYAQKGIDYCLYHGIMAGLPLLLLRKGVAKFYLKDDDFETYLDDSISLLRIQGLTEAMNDYISSAKRYRKTNA